MREDSATQQPSNRPRLVLHGSESKSTFESASLSSSLSEPVLQLPLIGDDGFPSRSTTLADPDQSGYGFPAELPDQVGAGRPTRRVRWIETVADSKAPATPAFHPDCQQLPAAARLDTQATLTLSGLIHDARNLVTTLDLYCDLLDVPGVLTPSCQHYAEDLRLIADGSRRILDKLAATEPRRATYLFSAPASTQHAESTKPVLNFPASTANSKGSGADRSGAQHDRRPVLGLGTGSSSEPPNAARTDFARSAGAFQRVSDTVETFASGARWHPFVSPRPIASLAEEIMANHNLLSALAGPGITVGLSIYESKRPIPISSDDLTRILVNLTKNAAEAMPQGGHIQIALEEFADRLMLSVSDTGCGLPESSIEEIFSPGYTTHVDLRDPAIGRSDWTAPHRGLGLAIVRSIVAAAGGSVTAANRRDVDAQQLLPPVDGQSPISGAIFFLNFPLQD